jgi:hypothetical protein
VVASKRAVDGRTGLRPEQVPQIAPARPWIVDEAAKESEQFQHRKRIIGEAERPSGQVVGRTYDPHLTCVGDFFAEVVPAPGLKIGEHRRVAGNLVRFDLENRGSQVAVRFSDGSGMLLPVMREFACEVVRHQGRTLAVSYSWLPYIESGVADLRAEVLGAATLGLLDTTREAARELARRLRHLKRFDPTLGLVSALAYVLAGDLQGAASVRDYMRRDLGIDLFDAWMLGGGGDRPLPLLPALPLLSQSWSLIDLFGAAVPEAWRRLQRVPGFWTVFEASAMDEVATLVRAG